MGGCCGNSVAPYAGRTHTAHILAVARQRKYSKQYSMVFINWRITSIGYVISES